MVTVGGLVGLSDPAGDERGESGVAAANGRLAGTDILINVGFDGLVGVAACPLEDDPSSDEARTYSTCVSAAASVLPFLLGSRIV